MSPRPAPAGKGAAKRKPAPKPPAAPSLGALAARIAALAPPRLAESWDNVGLLIGDAGSRVRRIMTALEVTAPVLAEARRRKADAIVAHHPLIFRPVKSITSANPAERLVMDLIRAGIGLVAAHTNLDSAAWGTNQILAEALGLKPEGPLVPASEPESALRFKFAVFTPAGHERAVIDAIDRGGGGHIGAYSHCTFRTAGTGTFLGGEGANPFIGRAGAFEEAEEFRLEAVVPRERRAAVLREVLKVHPYEEPAYDFFPLSAPASGEGLGCLASPPAPETLAAFIDRVKTRLGLKSIRLSGATPDSRMVRRAALCTGSGGSFVARAASSGAGVYVTGEANYHQGVEAWQRGIPMIEAGHFETERIAAPALAKRLAADPALAGAEFFAAEDDFQPFALL